MKVDNEICFQTKIRANDKYLNYLKYLIRIMYRSMIVVCGCDINNLRVVLFLIIILYDYLYKRPSAKKHMLKVTRRNKIDLVGLMKSKVNSKA